MLTFSLDRHYPVGVIPIISTHRQMQKGLRRYKHYIIRMKYVSWYSSFLQSCYFYILALNIASAIKSNDVANIQIKREPIVYYLQYDLVGSFVFHLNKCTMGIASFYLESFFVLFELWYLNHASI